MKFAAQAQAARSAVQRGLVGVVLGWAILVCGTSADVSAQPPEMPDDDAEIAELASPQPVELAVEEGAAPSGIDFITLISRGGMLMWPIGLMSVLVVTLAVERLISFRQRRMLPRKLVQRLSELMRNGGENFDPEAAFRACRENGSAAATVIGAMLMRTGRPLGEIEQAANESAQREADDYAGPIRWLNLAAAATPLMGLLGTVWGMIIAFHNSSTLSAHRSRSEQLSEGIYTALVTTLAGLAVAIPAAIMAQYLENRLSKMMHRIEELAFLVAPALERFTGRQRLDADARLRPVADRVAAAPGNPTPSSPSVAGPRTEGDKRTRERGETTAATNH